MQKATTAYILYRNVPMRKKPGVRCKWVSTSSWEQRMRRVHRNGDFLVLFEGPPKYSVATEGEPNPVFPEQLCQDINAMPEKKLKLSIISPPNIHQ